MMHLFQTTLYKMAHLLIIENDGIQRVHYALPNKRFILVDMSHLNVDNLTP